VLLLLFEVKQDYNNTGDDRFALEFPNDYSGLPSTPHN